VHQNVSVVRADVARIGRAQEKVLATLFPVDPACARQPPLYVRPGEFPEQVTGCYHFADIFALQDS
jgi:hypothetical protein